MRRVDEITGQERVAAQIAKALASEGRCVAAITGPEGSGKTRAAALVAARLEQPHRVIFRRGDPLLVKSPEAMLLGPPVKASTEEVGSAVLDVAQDVAELIAEGHIPFSRTLRRLFGLKGKSDRRLSPRQQAFVFEVAASRSKGPVVLIADNLHCWDSESLHFLAQIHSGQWDGIYPKLRRLRTILVWTPEQAGESFIADVRRLFGSDLYVEALTRVDRATFDELLLALGAPEGIPADFVDEVWGASGGHLLFAAQIVELLRSGAPGTAARSVHREDLSGAVKHAIESRLDRAGPTGEVVRRLIQAISIIGEVVGLHDLTCILGDERERVDWTVDQAINLGFVARTADEIAIAHDVIRRVFLAFLTPNQRAWHLRFGACLVKLRPWDYSRRAVHCIAAGHDDLAEVMRVMGLLQGVRDMRIGPQDDWLTPVAPVSAKCEGFLEALRRASDAEREGRYDDAIKAVENVGGDLPPRLAAERDLILARLLLLKRTATACDRGIALVEDLDAYRDTEPDLWLRAEELRIVLLAYRGRYDEARRVESMLRMFLHEREPFDSTAAHVENRLRRKAESIHAPRIANDRLRRALAYFDPSGDGSAPRDVLEYVLTLNNLGANELVIGDFDAAFERFARCYSAIEAAPQPVVKRVEIILSNLVVAHFLRTGVVPYSMALLAELTESMDVLSSDAALVRSNVAALLAMQGNPDHAASILSEAAAQLLDAEGFSEYTLHFVCSNLAVVEWLRGKDDAAAVALGRALASANDLEPDFRPYAKRRLEILRTALMATSDRDFAHLASQFRPGQLQVGEGWSFYGRPLGLTDLQFWTES